MNESDERFVYLFSSYFKKTATEQETNELFQLIEQSVNNDRLTLLMKQTWDEMQVVEPMFQPDKSYEIFNRILLAGAKKQTDAHIIKNRFSRKKYAAVAAILLVCSSLYFGLKHKDTSDNILAQKPVKVVHDALPGSNKAVLTLADGSQVPLDNAHLGTLSKQGQTTVSNTSNGKLIYSATGDASVPAVPQINTLATPRGGQYQIILPDGSKVYLNATSSIKYPTFFTGKNRKVEITGEVYFEVAKNPAMPFIVKTNHTEIEVLGTHFNVMAYDDEDATKTTLQEGSVKIKGDKWSGILKPGQQAVQNNHDGSSIIKEVDVDQELAWKNGLFQFTDDDIQTIMRKACRWYDLNVVYDGKIPVKQYSGRISRNVKASELLNMLKYTGVNAEIKEKTIYIRN
jgi:ferric-dicitrate binding protein FerR (iron transport regulator)